MNVTQFRLEVRASVIDRTGCCAAEPMLAGAVFRDYEGESISQDEARRREADPSRPRLRSVAIRGELFLLGALNFFGGEGTCRRNGRARRVALPTELGRVADVGHADDGVDLVLHPGGELGQNAVGGGSLAGLGEEGLV